MSKYTGEIEVIPYMSKQKIKCSDCGGKAGMVYLTNCNKRICSKCRKKDFTAETGNWQ